MAFKWLLFQEQRYPDDVRQSKSVNIQLIAPLCAVLVRTVWIVQRSTIKPKP